MAWGSRSQEATVGAKRFRWVGASQLGWNPPSTKRKMKHEEFRMVKPCFDWGHEPLRTHVPEVCPEYFREANIDIPQEDRAKTKDFIAKTSCWSLHPTNP